MRLYAVVLTLMFSYNIYSQIDDKEARFILDTINNRKIHLFVDKMPESSIELDNLMNYIIENNFWPEMDKSCWFDNIIYEFIVEPNGEISNIDVQIRGRVFCEDSLKTANYLFKMKENLNRLLKQLHWTSGELKGQKVPVLLKFPIQVHLQFD